MANTEKYLVISSRELSQGIDNYINVLFLKYKGLKYDYVSEVYPLMRSEMEEKGVNPETLDNLESHLKKTFTGIIEEDTEKTNELTSEIGLQIFDWGCSVAKKQGRKVILQTDEKTILLTDEKED